MSTRYRTQSGAHSAAHQFVVHPPSAASGTRRAVIVLCTLMLCGGAINQASRAAQPPAAQSAAKAKPVAPVDKALAAAQDRAVANYMGHQKRKAAAAKLARDRAAAAEAAAASKARADAVTLARAQDRVVAYYKGIPLVAARRVEVLTCFTGIQDKHARIGVQLVNGQVNHFSFYSKLKPRTCSIDVKRNGPYSQWEDSGEISRVTLTEEKGVFLIDRKRGSYRFVFRGVDRGRYCGMEGKINGSLTVQRGKSRCDVQGIMDGHQG